MDTNPHMCIALEFVQVCCKVALHYVLVLRLSDKLVITC